MLFNGDGEWRRGEVCIGGTFETMVYYDVLLAWSG